MSAATRIAFVLALAPTPAAAAEYLVQAGESLPQLAEQLYGDARRAELLAAANGLPSSSETLRPGQRLLVPAPEVRTVSGEETWESLARRWLGDERRAFLLVEQNRSRPEARPAAGTEITVPAIVPFRTTATSSFDDVAERFYGDDGAARLIRRFNALTGSRLPRGELVLLPVPDLQLTTVGTAMLLSQNGGAATASRRPVGQRPEAAVRQLESQLRDGLYVEVVEVAARLLGERPTLSGRQLVAILRALGTAYVALDREAQAIAVFREALQHQPDLEWNPITTSPKVLRVWDSARGVNRR